MEEEKRERKDWQSLLKKGIIAVFFLAIAFIFIAITSFIFRPPTEMEERENVSIFTNITNVTEMLEEIEFKCNRTILTGSEKDSYSYITKARNITTETDSSFLGKTNSEYLRKMTTRTVGGLYAGVAEIEIHMDENFSCKRANMSATIAGRAFQQEIPCEGASPTYEFCADLLTNIKNESITVPFGTFYSSLFVTKDNSTSIWIVEGISVPLKIEIADPAGIEMELKDFKRG